MTEDEWDVVIDAIQNVAVELLQSNDEKAVYYDNIAYKISEYEQ